MNNVIVAFPKMETAKNVKRILAQSGYNVSAVAVTGAQALAAMEGLETGIIVCGSRFADMMYSDIAWDMPKGFQMLLIAPASHIMDRNTDNMVCLSLPLKIHELLQTMEMMDYSVSRYKKKLRQKPKIRSKADQEVIEKAKLLLIQRNGLTEAEAHRYIQKRSMENGTGLVEISQMILSLMQEQ